MTEDELIKSLSDLEIVSVKDCYNSNYHNPELQGRLYRISIKPESVGTLGAIELLKKYDFVESAEPIEIAYPA